MFIEISYECYLYDITRRRKNDSDAGVNEVIENLIQIKKKFEDRINEITAKQIPNDTDNTFLLVGTLYKLSIYDNLFRELINNLKIAEQKAVKRMETKVNSFKSDYTVF